MSEVFVRRTTAWLLLLLAAMAIVCVALVVLLVHRPQQETENSDGQETVAKIIDSGQTLSPRPPIMKHEPKKANPVMASIPKEILPDRTPLPSSTEAPMEPWQKNYRIPPTTLPHHYDLFLHPDLQTGWFTGKVSILIGVTKPMDYLVVHVKAMNVTSTSLSIGDVEVPLKDYFEYKPNQFWVVRPRMALKQTNYTLTLEFNGPLVGHIVGFYKSVYTTKAGEKRAIATSKFQPTDARRAFPCFDEPSFKSTFSTSLVRTSQGYVALSNTNVKSEMTDSPLPGLTTVHFEKSVPMVTYLVCFIVCDFDYVETFTQSGTPFRVYATKDQVNRTHYARDIGVSIHNFFEDYFEIPYPLPKQDQIAIPDFVSGAMEHWGLITYRETNLLFDETSSSSYNKQRVASVVSHELAHMWFGNLVTLKWWDDLWLNEGFASYVEYKGVDHYEKDWDMESQFVIGDLQTVMELDEILSSHPIVQAVNHPDEITEIFDKISYSKGASVLRMLENFLGSEPFRIGIRNFLRRFVYANAVTQDLWDDLQNVAPSGLNVSRIMDTWTRQMGFPVVNIKQMGNDLKVSQMRYLVDPEADSSSSDPSPFDYKWDIPVTFKTDNRNRKQVWLNMQDNQITIERPPNSKWMKFNVDQYGYYRVNYDDVLWAELVAVLKANHEHLSSSDRSNLIDDIFSFAASGSATYDLAFDLASYLKKETHYIPWNSAYRHLKNLGHLLTNTPAYPYFRKYIVNLVRDHFAKLGWEDTGNHLQRRNRLLILSLACSNGYQPCLDGATQRFKQWVTNSDFSIAPNLRTLIYVYGIKGSGYDGFSILLERFKREINAQEKIKMMRGLASSKETWIIQRILSEAKNESVIRTQDFLSFLTLASRNPSALPHVWNFVRSEYDWLVKRYTLNNRYLGRMIRDVAFEFSSELGLKELNSFFSENPNAGSGARGRKQAIEKIGQNIKFIKRNALNIGKWMMANS